MSRTVVSSANAWESVDICAAMDDPSIPDRQTCLNEKFADPGTHTNHLLEFQVRSVLPGEHCQRNFAENSFWYLHRPASCRGLPVGGVHIPGRGPIVRQVVHHAARKQLLRQGWQCFRKSPHAPDKD